MKNALTYVTRSCPRQCDYCAIRDTSTVGKELTPDQWIEVWDILDSIGVSFNLILGNETWLLGTELIRMMEHHKMAFAIYTTAPPMLFQTLRGRILVPESPIDNFSCGIDYPFSYLWWQHRNAQIKGSILEKSWDAWQAFHIVRARYPHVDCQGNITIHRKNLRLVPDIIRELSGIGVFPGVNFIHYNKDGLYDFFPEKEEIKDFVFSENDIPYLESTMKEIREDPHLLQNPHLMTISPEIVVDMGWHCDGVPYGGPTIDSDGSLRLCGYRKGKRTPKFSIFDLPEKEDDWFNAVWNDSMECPGCTWSYPIMHDHWECLDPEFGGKVLSRHAGRHIPPDRWSNRRIE